jgi:hypothetical protein
LTKNKIIASINFRLEDVCDVSNSDGKFQKSLKRKEYSFSLDNLSSSVLKFCTHIGNPSEENLIIHDTNPLKYQSPANQHQLQHQFQPQLQQPFEQLTRELSVNSEISQEFLRSDSPELNYDDLYVDVEYDTFENDLELMSKEDDEFGIPAVVDIYTPVNKNSHYQYPTPSNDNHNNNNNNGSTKSLNPTSSFSSSQHLTSINSDKGFDYTDIIDNHPDPIVIYSMDTNINIHKLKAAERSVIIETDSLSSYHSQQQQQQEEDSHSPLCPPPLSSSLTPPPLPQSIRRYSSVSVSTITPNPLSIGGGTNNNNNNSNKLTSKQHYETVLLNQKRRQSVDPNIQVYHCQSQYTPSSLHSNNNNNGNYSLSNSSFEQDYSRENNEYFGYNNNRPTVAKGRASVAADHQSYYYHNPSADTHQTIIENDGDEDDSTEESETAGEIVRGTNDISEKKNRRKSIADVCYNVLSKPSALLMPAKSMLTRSGSSRANVFFSSSKPSKPSSNTHTMSHIFGEVESDLSSAGTTHSSHQQHLQQQYQQQKGRLQPTKTSTKTRNSKNSNNSNSMLSVWIQAMFRLAMKEIKQLRHERNHLLNQNHYLQSNKSIERYQYTEDMKRLTNEIQHWKQQVYLFEQQQQQIQQLKQQQQLKQEEINQQQQQNIKFTTTKLPRELTEEVIEMTQEITVQSLASDYQLHPIQHEHILLDLLMYKQWILQMQQDQVELEKELTMANDRIKQYESLKIESETLLSNNLQKSWLDCKAECNRLNRELKLERNTTLVLKQELITQ